MDRAYHHGALKAALVDAGLEQLRHRPAEAVSVVDAAKAVGVSSAAPYRHFRDRAAMLAHMAARGFERAAERMLAAIEQEAPGSVEGIVAAGCAYLRFGMKNTNLLDLMLGAQRFDVERDLIQQSIGKCSGVFADGLRDVLSDDDRTQEKIEKLAIPLWAMVHGYSSLLSRRDSGSKGVPGLDEASFADAVNAYIRGILTATSGLAKQPANPFEFADAHPSTHGCIAFGLRRASRVATRRFETALKPVSLTAFQFTALVMLSEMPGLVQGRMAHLFGMDLSTLNRNLGPLLRRGVITVAEDDGDRRVRRVSLTKSGEEVLAQAIPLWREAQAWGTEQLGAEPWQDIRQSLSRLSD